MDIAESLERVHQSEEVLGQQFYAEFMRRYPEAEKLFANVNMTHQGALFTMQLSVIVAYHRHKTLAPGMYLQVLGTRHKDRGVPAEMYTPFCEVLLEVMATFFADDWDDDLKNQWRLAMQEAAEKMLEGYDQRYHV